MNKDVKTGMLIGLGLVIVAVVAISIWPGGAVHQRLKRADGKKIDPPPAASTSRISPPQESDSGLLALITRAQWQRRTCRV